MSPSLQVSPSPTLQVSPSPGLLISLPRGTKTRLDNRGKIVYTYVHMMRSCAMVALRHDRLFLGNSNDRWSSSVSLLVGVQASACRPGLIPAACAMCVSIQPWSLDFGLWSLVLGPCRRPTFCARAQKLAAPIIQPIVEPPEKCNCH
jgi:hypothetical protein